ncbi:UvrD-helicase domain-containing protein [Novosphingobium sp. G106]|uniref:UvrD-helicase domain-containing protein n=1 Tax=Novosphingobium sp. G106 TaxID=2849500 RepID=UPI001C2CCFB9|nr:UvrD-helicase domain-containing protein [Novosphingobium sp. G106]MBV1692055.1 UvrD-helicase domain-containing protein [Novosphingobium sp. G106]
MTDIAIVPAGAGAGKTYHIKETLAGLVRDGTVRPDRILAVTFTEAAANELRERIRSALLAEGDIAAALALEQAYVTTIHALGQRLLVEHALADGASPQLRLIEEGEQDLLLRRSLEKEPGLAEMARNLAAYGYSYSFGNDSSAEDSFRKTILGVVGLLRRLGQRGTDPVLADHAEAFVREGYGPVSGNDANAAMALRRGVVSLLAAFPAALSDPGWSESARAEFRKNFVALRALRGSLMEGRHDWRQWQAVRKLRLSGRAVSTPEGYDAMAEVVMAAAEALPSLPGPLEEAVAHVRALVLGGQAVMADYARRKRELGVIDYDDMVTNAAQMLAEKPDVLNAVLNQIDCVIIDEFQDTNPIQFAFLWHLAARAPRTLIVGDTKQAIMGFQGADPRLAEELSRRYPGDPLGQNWRSVPPIMDFVNAVGTGLFPGRYSALEPTRKATGQNALEVILQNVGERTGRRDDPNPARPWHIVADRIAQLLGNGEMMVEDRHSNVMRPLEARDIAVLCLTKAKCARYADALRSLGLPVRLNETGWWQSPVVAAAVFALRFVADPGDRHAALCVASLGPSAMPFAEALRALADSAMIAHDDVEALAALHRESGNWPVDALVARVIEALDLYGWCDRLSDPAQMRADLQRLEAEALAFTRTETSTLEAAGFHGRGMAVFAGWLEARALGQDDGRPAASGSDADGIEVLTWHGSKGREWPLVVVCSLNEDRTPRAGELRAEIPQFDDFEAILGTARLSCVPDYAAPEALERARARWLEDAREDTRRLLYVAFTRARDRLVIEWPKSPSKPKEDELTPIRILTGECAMMPGDNTVSIGGRTFSARITLGDDEMPPAFDAADEPLSAALRAPRHALEQTVRAMPGAIVAPSLALTTVLPLPADLQTLQLATGIELRGTTLTRATEKGTALHEGLRILLQRPDRADAVAAHCRVSGAEVATLAEQAEALRAALAQRGYPTLHVEQPLDIALGDGTVQTAIIDLLAQGPGGFMIVDHKSGPVPNPALRYATYWPQLATYAQAVERVGAGPVKATGIFWTHSGELTLGML